MWLKLLPALLGALVFLSGCGFENPLTGRPSKDLNTWLLGVWEHKSEKGERFRAIVTPKTGDRYWVTVQKLAKSGKPARSMSFEAYISRVGRSNFLTLKCLEGGPEIAAGRYAFAHYQVLDQNSVRIRLPALDADPSASGYQLRKEIRAKVKDGTLYPDIGTAWQRISEVYWAKGDEPQPMQPLRFPPELDPELGKTP
ncbi:MAG: hypothetical protein Fur0032_14660 [Terrimicrobiaceae bacterium]